MIPEIVKQWDEKKGLLEAWIREKGHPDSYKSIVEALFTHVIEGYQVSNLVEIDHGDYQGTQIYLIPEDTYQPSTSCYLWVDNYYGSCSGCDTLQAIAGYYDDPPTDEQIGEYMTLALHLVQGLQRLQATEVHR